METLKKYLSVLGLSILAVIGAILGFKLRKLKQLEAKEKVREYDDQLKPLNESINDKKEDANANEKNFERLDAERRRPKLAPSSLRPKGGDGSGSSL